MKPFKVAIVFLFSISLSVEAATDGKNNNDPSSLLELAKKVESLSL
jgi:hypothetical protein